jgi:hypothetical protein
VTAGNRLQEIEPIGLARNRKARKHPIEPRDPRRMGAQGGTTDIIGFFRLGSFGHSATAKTPQVVT